MFNRFITRHFHSASRGLFSFGLLALVYSLLLTTTGCETPEKVLKSTDIEYKKAKATFWYNKKEYVKAIPVLEELIGLMKGRQSVEDLYYMYCMANFKQGDYLISGYHFKNFYDQYPSNEHAEECLFMAAESNRKMSPKPDLDQTYTIKALESYQFFLNMFPESSTYLKQSNEAIAVLRKKLEKKAINNAELYYKTSNYKAAATCYENLLVEYPDMDDPEKISFLIVKSNYKFAYNSISSKKAERFRHVVDAYNSFKYKYPNSKYIDEATKYEQLSHYYAVTGAFEWAENAPLDEREKLFNQAFHEAKEQLPFITVERQKDDVEDLKEKGQFLIVKYNYLLSELRKSSQKLPTLNHTIETYYTFVDLFPKSKYLREAERIFNNSTEQIKKLKVNG